MKRLILTFAALFALFLLFSTVLVQAGTSRLTETRKSSLVRSLAQAQMEVGAFHFFINITNADFFNEGGTSLALIVLSILDGLTSVDAEKAVSYLASAQKTSGGFGAFYGYDGRLLSYDLECTYTVVHALKILNALDRINATAVVDFVLARYNQSTGASQEFVTEAYGKKYALSSFGLHFRTEISDMAYAIPNVISTYESVSILADLDMLSRINVTRTAQWLLSSQASNGAFRPYPTAEPTYLPGWSSLITNPFDVDSNGTGVPYTFAAVEALKRLGRLDSLSQNDKEKIREYVLSSQVSNGNFNIHPDYHRPMLRYTFYAVITLADIDMLPESQNAVTKTINLLNEAELLNIDNSWPLPQSVYTNYELYHYESDPYGLFLSTSTGPLGDTFYAVSILNATEDMALLDQTTPRAARTWLNLIILSALVTGTAVAIILITLRFRKKTQKPTAETKPQDTNQSPVTPSPF